MVNQQECLSGFVALAAGCGLALALASAPAHAAAILHIDDGGTNILNVVDNGAGDLNPNLGAIVHVGSSFGNWALTVAVGTTKPFQGTADQPQIHFGVNAASLGAGVLNISFADTDFVGDGYTIFSTGVGGLNGGAAGSTISIGSSVTPTEAAVSTANLAQFGPFGFGAFSDSGNDPYIFSGPTSYTLQLAAQIVHTGSGTSSFDADLRVPEPATLSLLGAALLLSGLFMRGHTRPQR